MINKLEKLRSWKPPENWQKFTTFETHTAGEPLRIITSGLPKIPGETMLEKRRYFMENLDYIRRSLMWEPRGHADMYGAVITEPVSPEADFGVIYLHNEGYSTGCGHAVIALGKVAVVTGIVDAKEPVTEIKIDTPSGLVKVFVEIEKGKIRKIFFHNVPSFVYLLDRIIEVPKIGEVKYDVAYGGDFYAFVDSEDVGLKCTPDHYRDLIDVGMRIKRAIMKSTSIKHPFEEDLGFLYGTIFTCPPQDGGSHSRHVTIFAEGEVDRCPTGTGVSARLSLLYQRGEIDIDEEIVIESIINTKFTGKIVKEMEYGPYKAIIPEVGGNAYIIAKNTFIIDPSDPLTYGFFLR